MKRSFYTLVLILFTATSLSAQFYSSGEDPARLKWSQVRAGNFQLIYPRGLDSMAFRYAYLFEQVAPYAFRGLDAKMPKLPVVLHPYTTDANGLVIWAPKRMELNTMYDPANQATTWEKSLVIHESRHVAQMQRSGEHLFKFLHFLVGEQSEGLASGLVFSSHLYEGDAVLAETEYSNSGRGRQAEFLMPYKALFADSVYYSFDKYYLGSYKDYIPNHYAFGYMQLSAGRYLNEKSLPQGSDAMSSLFTYRTKNPLSLAGSFRKAYGCSRTQLWKKAQSFYAQKWEEEAQQKAPFDEPKIISDPEKTYVSYQDPVVIDSSIYVVKSSLSQNDHLVRLLPNGKSEFLTWLGGINSMIAPVDEKIYWTESVSGLRWAHENFSVLKEYDIPTGKIRTLSRKSCFYHPSPSEDGKKIAMASYYPDGSSKLILWDRKLGMYDRIIDVPQGVQLGEMIWIDDSTIFATVITDGGSGVYAVDLKTEAWKEVLPPMHFTVHSIDCQGDDLYFGSDMDGTDNFYRMNLSNGLTYRITNMRFGGYCYLIEGDDLYLSNYSKKGYEVAVLKMDTLQEQLVSSVSGKVTLSEDQPIIHRVADQFSAEGGFDIDSLVIPSHLSYPVEKYSKGAHLFNIHSWAPFYYDKDELASFTFEKYYESVAPGAMLISQNVLGTFTTQLGYSYHDGFHAGHLRMSYAGWYPVISLNVDYNDAKANQYRLLPDGKGNYELNARSFGPALDVDLMTYIPFSFDGGGYSRGLIPSIHWVASNNSYYAEKRRQYNTYQYAQFGLQYYSVLNQSMRDIFPRLGFGLNLQCLRPLSMDHYFTGINYARAYAYVPGLMKNHSFCLSASYQHQIATPDTRLYLGNIINMPAGISETIYESDMASFSCQYAFPVHLDLSVPSLLYIKRLQCIPYADGLFYPTTLPESPKKAPKPTTRKISGLYSVGSEFLLDFYVLRLSSFEMTAGVRWSYLFDKGHRFEMVFSVPYL